MAILNPPAFVRGCLALLAGGMLSLALTMRVSIHGLPEGNRALMSHAATDWLAIRRAHARKVYAVVPERESGVGGSAPGGVTPHVDLVARNPAQRLKARFNREGMSVSSSVSTSRWQSRMRLVDWGYPECRQVPQPVEPIAVGSRVEFRRGPLCEWYVNDAAGVEHGFDVSAPPGRSAEVGPQRGEDSGAAEEPKQNLEFRLQVDGGLRPEAIEDGNSVRFTDGAGRTAFRYQKLKAWDRTGRSLPAVMRVDEEPEGAQIVLAVNDSEATYPITIDPLITCDTVLSAQNAQIDDRFGATVAVDGNTVAVAAPQEDVNGVVDAGAVHVFVRGENGWEEEAVLHGNLRPQAQFGTAVALRGDTLVVGASNEGNGSQPVPGAVYIFARQGNTWEQQSGPSAPSQPGQPDNMFFGSAVSLSADTLVVSAAGYEPGGVNAAGGVFVYHLFDGDWSPDAVLTSMFPNAGGGYGNSIAIDGSVLVAGALNQSAAEVFVRGPNMQWTRSQRLQPPDAGAFGRAVVVQEDLIAVGAADAGVNGPSRSGVVYLYRWNGVQWVQQPSLPSLDSPMDGRFGAALDIRGERILVGATGGWGNGVSNSGLAHLFRSQGTGWSEEVRLRGSGTSEADDFGCAVALTDDWIAVGSRFDEKDTGPANTGLVYVVGTPPDAPVNLQAEPLSSSQIRLQWTGVGSGEEGYEIYRRTGALGAYALVGAVGADARSFEDAGLVANTEYFYRVRAFNDGGPSDYSAPVGATTLPLPPSHPTTLVARALSQTEVRLTWTDGSGDETGFRVERSADGVEFAEIEALGANATSYVDEPGSEAVFHYRVRAVNGGGFSPYSNTAQAAVLPAPPAPPTGLQAETQSSTAIQLSWTDGSDNESGFEVERSDDAGDTFSQVTKVGTGTTEFRSGGLEPGTVYVFRVRAFNAGGASEYSDTAEATTLPEKPAAPTALTATALSSTSVLLGWADASGSETAYRVERRQGSGAYQEIAFLEADTIAYQDDAVLPASTYTYRVRAWNEGGNSAYSNEAEVTTSAGPPSAPTGLAAAVVSASRIDLTWTDASDNETGFRIERRLPSQSFQGIADVAAGSTSYASEGLAAGTTYLYRVRAFNAGGVSAPSDEVSATTLTAAPAAPSGLTVTLVAPTEARLSWTDASTNESAFRLERKAGAEPFDLWATLGANTTTFRDGGLEPDTSYVYRLRAVNAAGESESSEEVPVTTPAAVPNAPEGLAAVAVSSSRIDLTWTDASGNETGFRVERRTGGGSFVLRAEKAAGTTSHSDEGLTAGTTYVYRVRAFNGGGQSAPGDEASATTLPAPPIAPANLVVEVVSASVLRLEWEDRSDNEAGFRIERAVNGGGYAPLAEVGANVAFYRNTGLTAGTTYSYKVRAFNAGGESVFANAAGAMTLPQPPTVPTGLTATALSASEIRLDWTDASNNESGFRLERRVGSGPFAQWVTLGANTVTFRDAGLQAATAYTYRLRAVNAGGESAETEASATTLPLPPEAPTGLTATVVSAQVIDLAWSDASSNEAFFELERRPPGGPFMRIAQPGAGVKSYRDGNLSPNSTYLYRVRAVNAGGASGYSPEATGSTLPLAPASPDGLGVTALSASVLRLEWNDRSESETTFRIERTPVGGGSFEPLATVGSNVTTYRDAGLAADQSYRYRVRAVNAGGESVPSAEAEGRTLPLPPSAPTGLAAQVVSARSIRLTWQDASGSETGFEVERKVGATAGSGTFHAIATLAAGGTEFVDTGLAPATVYAYRVRAVNAGGGSDYLGPVEATTHPEAPPAPEDLAVGPTSRTVLRLTWGDTSSNETGFEVQHRGGDGSWGTLVTLPANSTSHNHTGLQPGSTHSYRVRAVNAGGASAYSGTATATTYALDPPTKLVAARVNATSIRLNWSDSTQGEAGFAIERRTGGGGFVEIKRVRAGARTHTDARLTRGVTYTYRVRAFGADGGVSAYSNEAGLLLPAAAVRKKR